MSRKDLVALLTGFAGRPPPAGHDQDDWDDWLVAAVLRRCRDAGTDETALVVTALDLLAPLPTFPQLVPHLERHLKRPLTEEELSTAARRRSPR